jgi:hypothetical protein
MLHNKARSGKPTVAQVERRGLTKINQIDTIQATTDRRCIGYDGNGDKNREGVWGVEGPVGGDAGRGEISFDSGGDAGV